MCLLQNHLMIRRTRYRFRQHHFYLSLQLTKHFSVTLVLRNSYPLRLQIHGVRKQLKNWIYWKTSRSLQFLTVTYVNSLLVVSTTYFPECATSNTPEMSTAPTKETNWQHFFNFFFPGYLGHHDWPQIPHLRITKHSQKR